MDKWEMVRLGDVCEIVSGTTPSTRNPELWDGNVKWIAPAEINDDSYFIFDTVKHISEKAGLKSMPAGTVLLSSRAPIGKVAIAGVEMCCNQGFKNLICSDKIHNRYLYRYLKNKTDYLNSLGRGATFKEISKSIVEEVKIPLPSVEVQQQIADALDRASVLIEKRKAQIDKLDLLVKSQFIGMFGDPVTNPKGWEISNINDICNIIVDCPHSTPVYLSENTGYICLRTSVLKNHRIDWNMIEYISKQQYIERTKRYIPQKNDIVYSREGAILGIAAVINRDEKIALGQRMMLFSVDTTLCDSTYLWFILNQRGVTRQVQDRIGGSASPHINVKDIKSFKIPLPPLSLQTQFADFVQQVDFPKSLFQKSLEKLEQNYKSLMQKCFRGEVLN